MNIRNLKKAMKNSSFLTIGVHNHGYYAINEGDRIIFHKEQLEIANTMFSTFISYKEINRLIIEQIQRETSKHKVIMPTSTKVTRSKFLLSNRFCVRIREIMK